MLIVPSPTLESPHLTGLDSIGGFCPEAGHGIRQGLTSPTELNLQHVSNMNAGGFHIELNPQVNEGTNITADSFYSSQGRADPSFNDENDKLISEVLKKYPRAITMDTWHLPLKRVTLIHLVCLGGDCSTCCTSEISSGPAAWPQEMETFQLFHLARSCLPKEPGICVEHVLQKQHEDMRSQMHFSDSQISSRNNYNI